VRSNTAEAKAINTIRALAMDAVEAANSGPLPCERLGGRDARSRLAAGNNVVTIPGSTPEGDAPRGTRPGSSTSGRPEPRWC